MGGGIGMTGGRQQKNLRDPAHEDEIFSVSFLPKTYKLDHIK